VLYAPNAFTDARGRVLMLAWLQELRGSASSCGFDYAGCLSLPRVLTLRGALRLFCLRTRRCSPSGRVARGTYPRCLATQRLWPGWVLSRWCGHHRLVDTSMRGSVSWPGAWWLLGSQQGAAKLLTHTSTGLHSSTRSVTEALLGPSTPLEHLGHPAERPPMRPPAGGRLHQAPAPELRRLRKGPGVHMRGMRLGAGAATPVPGVRGPSLDVEVTLRRGGARRAGVLLRAWLHAGPGGGPPAAAALVVDWQVRPAASSGGAGRSQAVRLYNAQGTLMVVLQLGLACGGLA